MLKLGVWSNGQPVGTVTFDTKTDLFTLDYDPDWVGCHGFPLSPRLDQDALGKNNVSVEVRRFLENLLPEGQALEDAVSLHQISKSNVFGLVAQLGKESTGALSFLPENISPEQALTSKREITQLELSQRIRNRVDIPFSVWDGKVRMSIAGFQDKIAVYKEDDGSMSLVEGSLASTHILKPEPMKIQCKHLVLNEFFCMTLAGKSKLKVASVQMVRVPEPVLLVERFDRRKTDAGIERIHIIDSCQALGLPPGYKYERSLGNGPDVKHIRDGVGLKKLFGLVSLSDRRAEERLRLLRWVIFQYLIGNADAHGKNVSYFVDENGIRLAPAYDLVCVELHDAFEHEMAMAIGDEFVYPSVRAFDWADFASTCGIPKRLLSSEMAKMAKEVTAAIPKAEKCVELVDDKERHYLNSLKSFIAKRLDQLASDAKLVPVVDLDA